MVNHVQLASQTSCLRLWKVYPQLWCMHLFTRQGMAVFRQRRVRQHAVLDILLVPAGYQWNRASLPPSQLEVSLIFGPIHSAALSTCIMISQAFWVCLHLLTSPLGRQSAETQVLISTCTPSLWSRCIVPDLLGSSYWIETITATLFNRAGTSKLGSTVMLVQSSTVFSNHAEPL